MWDHVGILRTAEGLSKGLNAVTELGRDLQATGLADGDRTFNLTWHDWLNLESLISISQVVGEAAKAREDSRGAHFREDFPETGDLEATTFTRIVLRGDTLKTTLVPVAFDKVKPGQSLIDDEAGVPPAAIA